jgi:hypothetical protein
MSKYKSASNVRRSNSSSSGRKDVPSAQDVKEEKKFFQVAILVTVIVIALIYWLLNR